MRRSLDPIRFNEIANAAGVREWIGGIGPVETAPLVLDRDNFCFLTDDQNGYYIYVRTGDGEFDVHAGAIPKGRGRQMLKAREESLRFMFTEGTRRITTTVPDGNAGADTYARQAGFSEIGWADKALDVNGRLVGVSHRELTYEGWLDRNAKR